ncbi:MAG: isocitrate dehydrogenase (NADP(+)) [Candidatus Tectomicrobia bacterium]|nr:isocitrate dehydrogenase (NADP(+)) [Candidatus Tectomicrobia bacterium]
MAMEVGSAAVEFEKLVTPSEGAPIRVSDGRLEVPARPIIPFIAGDGVGPDVTTAARRVLDAAVAKTWTGTRRLVWFEVFAGDAAQERYGEVLPADTLKAIETFLVALKGPLTTPVGGGIRSLNVTLRQVLDLYACIRPVRYITGLPAPVKHPEQMDMVIFRENTEDVYAGIEWRAGSAEAKQLIAYLNGSMGASIRADSGVGIKPISITGSKRLVRKAIQYALEAGRRSVTLVHKGNIMKFTEGAFRDWGYEVAREEFVGALVTEAEVEARHGGRVPAGQLLLNDRIADNMFQQVLTRTSDYDVLATTNLNGDYLSDACAAQIGGLGMAPGANIGDCIGIFEATHGTAPKYAGQNKVNPGSAILSGVMMLEYLGWKEAAGRISRAIEQTVAEKVVTYDLARQMTGAKEVGTSEFADAIIERL